MYKKKTTAGFGGNILQGKGGGYRNNKCTCKIMSFEAIDLKSTFTKMWGQSLSGTYLPLRPGSTPMSSSFLFNSDSS